LIFFKEYSNWTWIWYSEICDISALYFGADFPFNIGIYDNFHYLWVTKQLVMDILLNIFT